MMSQLQNAYNYDLPVYRTEQARKSRIKNAIERLIYKKAKNGTDKYMSEKLEIEKYAERIDDHIKTCTTYAQCQSALNMIKTFSAKYGDKPQVNAWAGSLALELRNKENEIIGKL